MMAMVKSGSTPLVCNAYLLRGAYSRSAAVLRVLRKSAKFNRARSAANYTNELTASWHEQVDEVFRLLSADDGSGWERLRREVPLGLSLAKADGVHNALEEIAGAAFASGDVDASAIASAEGLRVADEAGAFALRQLGVTAEFSLKDERVKHRIDGRRSAAVYAGQAHKEAVFDTIARNFQDLGSNPYDAQFISELRRDLRVETAWRAKRFALTETGIVSELVQAETYRKNGVKRKQWNTSGANTRPSHQALAGEVVGITESFVLDGGKADHPLDPELPADEIVNCHCYLSPVVEADFELDPAGIWRG